MDTNNILFRCSSLGYLMTEPKIKSEKLSETTKSHLIDVFVDIKYHRKEEISSKYIEKGNVKEEEAITLLSRYKKNFLFKNQKELTNNFIKGTPDCFLGTAIDAADETFDTKVSWNANTFFKAQKNKVDKMYYWQGLGYMILTKAKKHTIAYCLLNSTSQTILDEKRKLAWNMGIIDPQENAQYKEQCKQIEINHIFDIAEFKNDYPFFEFDNDLNDWKYDIPKNERIYTISFNRNEDDIAKLYDRISDCRQYIERDLFKIKKENLETEPITII